MRGRLTLPLFAKESLFEQAHRTGPMCAVCEDGYYEQAGGVCGECPSSGSSYLFFVFVACAILFVLWLTVSVASVATLLSDPPGPAALHYPQGWPGSD